MMVVKTKFIAKVKETGDGKPYIYIEEMDKENEFSIEHMSLHPKGDVSYQEVQAFADQLNSKIDYINLNLK